MKKVLLTIPVWAWVMTGIVLFVNTVYFVAAFKIPITGMGVRQSGDSCIVSRVLADSPAGIAGIQVNDALLMINDVSIEGHDYILMLNKYHLAGETVYFTVSRQGKLLEVPLKLNSFFQHYALLFSLLYIILTLILLLSLYLLYKKPDEKAVRVFSMYIFLLILSFNNRYLLFNNPMAILATSFFILGFTLYGPCLMYFHLVFPSGEGYNKLHLFVKACFVVGALRGLLLIVSIIQEINGHPVSNFSVLLRWSVHWMAGSLIVALMIAIIRYYNCTNKLVRKQLKLIISGSIIALITPMAFGFFTGFFQKLESEQHMRILVTAALTLASTIMFVFFILAIFRYRIWDIESVLRKAALYVAATVFIMGMYALILYIADSMIMKYNEEFHFLSLALAILVFMVFRDGIQHYIDKLFYKKMYDPASIIATFEERVAGKYEERDIFLTAADFITSVFPLRSVKAFCKNRQNYQSVTKDESDQPMFFEIPLPVSEKIRLGELIMVEDISSVPEFITGASMIVPIADKHQLYGFFLLGERLDDQSWKMNERHIITVVSRRTGSLLLMADLYSKNLNHQVFLERERARLNVYQGN